MDVDGCVGVFGISSSEECGRRCPRLISKLSWEAVNNYRFMSYGDGVRHSTHCAFIKLPGPFEKGLLQAAAVVQFNYPRSISSRELGPPNMAPLCFSEPAASPAPMASRCRLAH